MKLTHTILLLVAAGALLTYILVVDKEKLSTEQMTLKDQRLATFRPENINVIEMENPGEDAVRLLLRDGVWKLRQPFDDFADPERIRDLLRSLSSTDVIRKTRVDEGRERRDLQKQMGLDSDRQSVLLKGDGPQVMIIFGVDTPSGENVYAKLKPSSELVEVPREVKEKVFLTPNQLRQQSLTEFEPKKIVEIRVRRPNGDMELELRDGFWHFRKPLQAPADNQAVFDTLAAITATKIEKFVENTRENSTAYGVTDPPGLIHLVDGDGEKYVLMIGNKTADEKSVYVGVEGRDGIFQAPLALADFVFLPPDTWRERRVFRVPSSALKRITIQEGNKPPTELVRHQYGWMLDLGGQPTPAQQTFVTGLLEWMEETRVEEFVGTSTARRGEFGLEDPSFRVTFQSFSPAEVQAALQADPVRAMNQAPMERDWPTQVELRFGKEENGMVYLETPFQSTIVTIPAKPLEDMPRTPYMWRSLLLQASPEDQFASVEFQPLHGSFRRFVRAETGGWEEIGEPQDDAVRYLSATVQSLGKLRALEYVQQKPSEEHGLDAPVMIVKYTLRGEAEPRRLRIGAPAGDRGFYARLDGLDAVFILSRPDYEVIVLPMEVSQPKGGS